MTTNLHPLSIAASALGGVALFLSGALVGANVQAKLDSKSAGSGRPPVTVQVTPTVTDVPRATPIPVVAVTTVPTATVTPTPVPRRRKPRIRAAYLADLPSSGTAFEPGLLILNGGRYPHSIFYDFQESGGGGQSVSTSFNLDGKYRHFHAIAGMEATNEFSVHFEIRGDGTLLDEFDLKGGDPPESANAPLSANETITGVRVLTLSITITECQPVTCSATRGGWSNARVTP